MARVKTLRKQAKTESSRNFKLYHVSTTFLLENVGFFQVSNLTISLSFTEFSLCDFAFVNDSETNGYGESLRLKSRVVL